MVMLPILHAGAGQWILSAYTQHHRALPPVPMIPFAPGDLEGMVNMGWPAGMRSHETAQSVWVDGASAVQHGHDVGLCIPHVTVPPNSLMVVHSLLSKHEVMFPVSSVYFEDKVAGTYLLFLLGMICAVP